MYMYNKGLFTNYHAGYDFTSGQRRALGVMLLDSGIAMDRLWAQAMSGEKPTISDARHYVNLFYYHYLRLNEKRPTLDLEPLYSMLILSLQVLHEHITLIKKKPLLAFYAKQESKNVNMDDLNENERPVYFRNHPEDPERIYYVFSTNTETLLTKVVCVSEIKKQQAQFRALQAFLKKPTSSTGRIPKNFYDLLWSIMLLKNTVPNDHNLNQDCAEYFKKGFIILALAVDRGCDKEKYKKYIPYMNRYQKMLKNFGALPASANCHDDLMLTLLLSELNEEKNNGIFKAMYLSKHIAYYRKKVHGDLNTLITSENKKSEEAYSTDIDQLQLRSRNHSQPQLFHAYRLRNQSWVESINSLLFGNSHSIEDEKPLLKKEKIKTEKEVTPGNK